MEIKDLMNPSVVTIEPTASAALAARLLSRHNVGSLPVCGEDRRLRGMVTDRDIVLRCVAAEEDPAQTLMNPSVVTIEPTASAALAARLLSRHNVGSLPVCGEDRRLRGMVTDRDIVLRCVAAEEDPAQTLVRDIMTRGCASVSPHEDCRAATRLMAQQQVRRLPVVEEGKLVGIISLADLARSQRFDMEAAQALGEISENIVRR